MDTLTKKCELCSKVIEIYSWNKDKKAYYSCECEKSKLKIEEERKSFIIKNVLDKKDYYISNIGFSKKYLFSTFENFLVDNDKKRKAKELCIIFAERFITNREKTNKGLFMIGKPGTGKTHLCSAICNYIISKKPLYFSDEYNETINIKYLSIYNLLNRIKETYKEQSEESEKYVINSYIHNHLLIIDDLGKEYSRNNNYGNSWFNEKLYAIINGRYENEFPIIITSNLTTSELDKTIDPAIVSRIIEMCRGVKLEWADFRKQNYRNEKD